MNKFLLPTNFDEMTQTIKAKIKEEYGINDAQYDGSNVSILADIMSYAAMMINTNMNFGINESVLSSATTRRNITTLAREIGYEPAFRRSFKYEIKLRAKKGGLLEIPKFSKFTGGDKEYFYLEESKAALFGETAFITVTNKERFENLAVRNGTTPGDFILSDDSEIFEVLTKTDNADDQRLLLNNISTDDISKYSSIKTSLYKYNDESKTYQKLCGIETYVVDETNPDDKVAIFQLKEIVAANFPTTDEAVLQLKIFTDDLQKGSVSESFNGFTPFEYHKDSQILKFKLNDNLVTDKSGVKHTMFDLITPFRKKRFCLLFSDNTELKYDIRHEFCILENTEAVKETSIVVTEGKLRKWEDDKELERIVDTEDVEKGYINLDVQNVEEDGIFLEISRVNDKNELILHQPWTRRKTYLAESDIQHEDTTYLALEDFTSQQSFLKIYTQYAGTGTPLYSGNILYFTILESSGAAGACKDLMKFESDDFEVVPFYEDAENPDNNINSKLFSSGSNEETLESIKLNAPLFKNIAERLVTKNDYKIYCKKFQFVEQAQIWGGEELDGAPQLGHVFFSFIPKSRITEFESDENNEVFTLKNRYERDLFYLPLNQIISQNDGGSSNSIFSELERKKIITLQFHNVQPTYLDFIIKIKLVKYLANMTDKAQRQMVFDGVREYFNEIEHFDSNIFSSNIIKYIDRKFNDETGINLTVNLETSMIKDDFSEDGVDVNQDTAKQYKFQTLFEFPVGGIFEPDVMNQGGVVTKYGKVIKSKLPTFSSDKDGFLNAGDEIIIDYDNVTYIVKEQGKEVEKTGALTDVDSSVISFKIPLIHKANNEEESKNQKFGNLMVYPDSYLMYLEINATESTHEEDLASKLPIDVFNTRRKLTVTNDGDLTLRRNTFPRLIRVEIH